MKNLSSIKKSCKMVALPSIFIYIISCVSLTIARDTIQRYKISMVSSGNANKPVLFSHGESPLWDTETQSLYFVDVHKQNVHRLDYDTGDIYVKHIGYGQVNVVSLVTGSRRLLVAVRAGLYLLDWDVAGDAALRLLTTVDNGLPDNVINEGKADPEGRLWFGEQELDKMSFSFIYTYSIHDIQNLGIKTGTKGPQSEDDVLPDKATFYSIDQDGFTRPRVQLRPITISNGLTWALNNSVMYYIDSPTRKIEAFDYNQDTGELSGRRTIIDISNYGYEDAIPDGMTIDSQGHLWVAIMFGGSVLHINPDSRQIVYGYKLPVPRITSLCWGGPNLDELFVTTAQAKDDDQLEGAIFTIRGTGSYGVPMYSFKFDNADKY